jgi:hypothetical protein
MCTEEVQLKRDKIREENMSHDEGATVLSMGNRLCIGSNISDGISTWYRRRLAEQFGFIEGSDAHEKAMSLISTVFKITKEHYTK